MHVGWKSSHNPPRDPGRRQIETLCEWNVSAVQRSSPRNSSCPLSRSLSLFSTQLYQLSINYQWQFGLFSDLHCTFWGTWLPSLMHISRFKEKYHTDCVVEHCSHIVSLQTCWVVSHFCESRRKKSMSEVDASQWAFASGHVTPTAECSHFDRTSLSMTETACESLRRFLKLCEHVGRKSQWFIHTQPVFPSGY